ncbi:hypothetical protein ACFPIJ_29690 [Dactylosporangium cerinum]|uniref:UbiC transcription regulator-associated domain-containing protein n=1 Tax=Dactylosporangium cerinum TaxID=1434730 RepID=A0ABV9W0A4_9ACTN
MRKGEQPPWIVPDGLWERIEPLLPQHPRRSPTASAGAGSRTGTVTRAWALGIDREVMLLVRWEYDIDVEGRDLGFVLARASVRIHPPPHQWEIDHGGFARLFPLSSFDALTGLDSAFYSTNRAQVTVFGLAGDRFQALAGALNTLQRPVLADILQPGEIFVSMATVRDAWMTNWTNSLTIKTVSETNVLYRAAAH